MRKFVNYGVFYSVWLAMILGETYAWAIAGYLGGLVFFIGGGMLLAEFHHRHTAIGEKPLGWPLQLAKFVTVRHPHIGLAVNAFFNGAPGVGIIETSMGYTSRQVRTRACFAAVGYAVLWCFIHYVRPHSVIPIYWHPSLAAVQQLWEVFVG